MMRYQVSSFRRWLVVVLAALIILILGSIYWQRSRPTVISVSPVDGSAIVPVQSPLKITFSRTMQPATVLETFSTIPSRLGTTTWEENTLIFTPEEPWPAGNTISVTIGTTAQASAGPRLAAPVTFSFKTAQTMLAYLWPYDGPASLYLLDTITGESTFLEAPGSSIIDFTPSLDGRFIYYTVDDAGPNSQIMRYDRVTGETIRLAICENALCQRPQISPDGTELAFENTTTTQILKIQTAQIPREGAVPVRLGGTQHPAWSSSGILAAYDRHQEAYLFQDPNTGSALAVRNQTGEPGSWGTNGWTFVTTEIIAQTASISQASQLIRFDLSQTGSQISVNTVILTPQTNEEFTTPVFSPDGTQIAYAHRYLDASRWTRGRQIWLMNANGTNLRQLTDAPLYNHLAFAWHPDGKQLAYLRFNQATLNEPPEIWLVNTAGGTPYRLVIGGVAPQWLP